MVRTVAIGFGCRSSSRMVRSCRREWFGPSQMVQTAVANGLDRRPSSRMVQTAVRRREWFGAVANGSDHRRKWFRPSRIVIGDGLGAIGDGEARRRLGLGVRRLGLGVRRLGLCFRKIKTDICYVFDLYSKPFSDEINFVSIGHLQRRLRDSSL